MGRLRGSGGRDAGEDQHHDGALDLVEGNDKYWARTKVLQPLVEIPVRRSFTYKPADPLRRARRTPQAGKSPNKKRGKPK